MFPLDKLRIKYETDIRVDRHCLPQPEYAVHFEHAADTDLYKYGERLH